MNTHTVDVTEWVQSVQRNARRREKRQAKKATACRAECDAVLLATAERNAYFAITDIANEREAFTRSDVLTRMGGGEHDQQAVDALLERAAIQGAIASQGESCRVVSVDDLCHAIRIYDLQ
jgi:hypothetical protein